MGFMISRFSIIILASLISSAFAAPTTRPSNSAPQLEKSGWTLTFHDEFDGSKLDESKWMDRYPYGRTHSNNEQEYYAPDGYTVSDGQLHLNAKPVRADARDKTKGMPYTSGMASSHGKFSQKYGWFEIRARFPSGKGYWPAFWLLPENGGWPPEIDILEILGHEPAIVHFTVHFRDAQRRHRDDSHQWTGPDFSE